MNIYAQTPKTHVQSADKNRNVLVHIHNTFAQISNYVANETNLKIVSNL